MATDVRKQVNGKAKNIVSLITAGALTVAGTIGIAALGRNLKNKKGDINLIGETSISNIDETTLEVEQSLLDRLNLRETFDKYDLMEYEDILEELPLLDDFDINDKEAVKKRAKAIYNFSEKEVDVDMIVNLIYMINEKYKNIKFPSDEDKYVYIQKMSRALQKLMYCYCNEWVSDMNKYDKKNFVDGDELKKAIFGYTLLPDNSKGSKGKLATLALIQVLQLRNIINDKELKEVSKLYYNYVKDTTKENNGKKLYTENLLLYLHLAGWNATVTPYLSEKEANMLKKQFMSDSLEVFTGQMMKSLNISKSDKIDDSISEGSFAEDYPYKDGFNGSDSNKANGMTGVATNRPANDKVSSGGVKVGGGSKQVNTPTTNVVTETYVATPITDAPTKPKKKDPVKSTTSPNKKDESNTKVPTTNPNTENEKKPTSTPTTEKFETPTSKNEEVVEDAENLGIYDSFEEFLEAQEKKKSSKGSVNYVDDADSKEMGSAKTK